MDIIKSRQSPDSLFFCPCRDRKCWNVRRNDPARISPFSFMIYEKQRGSMLRKGWKPDENIFPAGIPTCALCAMVMV